MLLFAIERARRLGARGYTFYFGSGHWCKTFDRYCIRIGRVKPVCESFTVGLYAVVELECGHASGLNRTLGYNYCI